MKLDGKWKHVNNSEYDKDDTVGMDFHENPFKKVLVDTAIAAGGIMAYKSGALKPLMKRMYEYASDFKPYSSSTITAFKNWSKKDVDVSVDSIFKNPNIRFKELFKDMNYSSNIVSDTLTDLKDLKIAVTNSFKETKANGMLNLKYNGKGAEGSKLIFEINKIKGITEQIKGDNSIQGKVVATALMHENLMKRMSLTAKEAENSIKRTGYKPITLGDIIGTVKDKSQPGGFSIYSNHPNMELDNNSLGIIKDFMAEGNKKSLYSNGKFKDIILDKNILIDETGRIVDTRNASNSMTNFVQSMARDYHIPFIKFNPLRAIGVDTKLEGKNYFAIFHQNTIQPAITGKAGNVHISDVKELGKHPLIGIDGDTYKFSDDMSSMEKIRSNQNFHLINGDKKLSIEVHNYRKISNLNTRDFEGYENAGDTFKSHFDYYKYKIAKTLDVGFQDHKLGNINDILDKGNTSANVFKWLNPDTYGELISIKLMGKFKPYKDTIGDDKNLKTIFGNVNAGEDLYFATNKATTFSDAFDQNTSTTVKDVFSQIFARRQGEDMPANITRATTIPYFLLGRINDTMSKFGLGLSNDSMGSTFDIAKNMILKRALPIYGAYQTFQYVNYLSEGDPDENGNRNNLEKSITKQVMKLDIGWHEVKDKLGITSMAKSMSSIMPGIDQIGDIPGINMLDLSTTTKDRIDYMDNGEVAVRKGRYWSLGNTAFTGGKVNYYEPNVYRRIMADVDFSDVRYGSRKEYFDHAAFPTPLAPLAPIRHFITDRYHYEDKHYNDRPYLESSPMGENIPIVGPMIGSTVGQIIKPSVRMHPEYWKDGHPRKLEGLYPQGDIEISNNIEDESFFGKVSDILNKIVHFGSESKDIDYRIPVPYGKPTGMSVATRTTLNTKHSSKGGAKVVDMNDERYSSLDDEDEDSDSSNISIPSVSISEKVKLGDTRIILPSAQADNNVDTDKVFDSLDVYETTGGNVSVVSIGKNSTKSVNEDLKTLSIKKILDTNSRANISPVVKTEKDSGGIAQDAYSIKNVVRSQIVRSNTDAGMYGFINSGFLTGNPGAGTQQIETSGYMTSFNKTFWDKDLGGLGGDYSEIFRRFVPQKRKDIEYFNPIKNDMPRWMPGADYFQNFQDGDPYSKILRGEMRLPGQGYERLNDIGDPTKMSAGVRDIGKSIEGLEKHFLSQDTVIESEERKDESVSSGLRNNVLSNWRKTGLAVSTKGDITDPKHNIYGRYDALIHDNSTASGIASASVETVSGKTFNEIHSNKAILDEHMKEINYVMWATGTDKGYVHYINEDDSSEQMTIGMKFDKGLFKDTINNLEKARGDIKKRMNTGEITRGDLYSQIDRFKILADSAPYSKEFQEQNAIISRMKLTAKEKEEVSEVRNRVKESKKPMRIYEYKFKHADVVYDEVTITKRLDSNTFMTAEMPNNPIRLAGLHISDAKANENREEIDAMVDKYFHPGKKLKIAVDADPNNQIAKDTLNTIHVVAYSHGTNINKLFIDKGLAKEKEKDWSPTGVHARFNASQIAFGSAWERIAHADSFINTKFMQVRSAKENYERREVYGKDFQSWDHPIKDFIVPMVQTNIHRPFGIIMGGLVGAAFGNKASSRMIGASIGAGTVIVGKMITGKNWIPERRKKQRELNEYVDMLKFVKNKRLFEEYSEKALKQDHIDVNKMFIEEKELGKKRSDRTKELAELKRVMKINQRVLSDSEQNKILSKPLNHEDILDGAEEKTEGLFSTMKESISDIVDKKTIKGKFSALKRGASKTYKYAEDKIFNTDDEKFKARLKSINKEMNEIKNFRKAYKTSDNATKAIYYHQKAEETMYGYDVGEPLTNILKALPKKDREYMKYFLKAPLAERKDILRIVPNYMKIPLQSTWGMKVDKKEDIVKYFTEHQLPGKEWEGWNEDKDMDSIKVKLVKHEAQETGEFNIWQKDVDKANQMGEVPLPKINFRSNADTVRHKMIDLLGDMGFKDVQVNYNFTGNDCTVNTNIHQDKRDEVNTKLNKLTLQ